ncbi:MAG: DNA mismatch endonuclease Vsr [Acidobacteria bacterium ACB1]|nr:DNA mismatch endonuclease Vsr [Acidobacteria bacterium ACB1]RIJ90196.1 MAG: very short patch repair endonuclease [Acidobacteriota bacterium]
MDRLSKERRSWLMSRVGSKNTTPELIVRSLVHRLGFRFRLHYRKLPGKPDLAFPGRKKVIFVHGCFWHGHKNCSKGRLPKSNIEVWDLKIARNRERDRAIQRAVKRIGWSVLVVWQCELRTVSKLETRLLRFLSQP